MIKLRQTGGELSASGAGSRDHDKRPGGFNIIVFAVTLRAYDGVYIGGIILYGIVRIMPHSHHFQPPAEGLNCALAGVLRNNHRAYQYSHFGNKADKAQHLHIVGYADIRADLRFSISAAHAQKNNLDAVAQLIEQLDLAVGIKARQYARAA